jgi:serine/threonine protein kinase
MPRLPENAMSLYAFLKESKYRERLDVEGKARLAARLADSLDKLHAAGIVFSDMNPKNFYLTDAYTQVRFIDADSFQAPLKGNPIPSRGVTAGYASPDAITAHKANRDVLRTQADDNFVLAILIFQLLVDRAHPFATGSKFAEKVRATLNENILARRYAFSDISRFHPEGDTPDLYVRLATPIKTAFHRSFLTPHTVPAADWVQLLLAHSTAPFTQAPTPEPDPAVWNAPPAVAAPPNPPRQRRVPSHPLKPVLPTSITKTPLKTVAAVSAVLVSLLTALHALDQTTQANPQSQNSARYTQMADEAFADLMRQYPDQFQRMSDAKPATHHPQNGR